MERDVTTHVTRRSQPRLAESTRLERATDPNPGFRLASASFRQREATKENEDKGQDED
jgi:hypothetical protein